MTTLDPCREYLDEFGSIEKAFEQLGIAYCKMRRELAAAEAKISRGYVRRPVSAPKKPPKPAPPAIDDGWIGTGKSDD